MSEEPERPSSVRLTPAGEQVEDALATGHLNAAFNLYLFNIRDGVDMTADPGSEVSAAWHRWASKQVDFQAAPSDGDLLREALLEDFTPSLEERTVRNERGEVIGTEVVANEVPDEKEGR